MSNAPKILIENQGGFGPAVEQVALDTNRVNVAQETTSRLANMIAISSRATWADLTSWLSYTAAVFAVSKFLMFAGVAPWLIALGVGVPVLLFLALMGAVLDRRATLAPHGMIRYFLLFIGAVVAAI
jgi:hypothetical protein